MTKDQKKEYKLLMLEALDVLVIPKLEEMGEDISGLRKDVSGLKQDVSGLKKDMKIVKEDVKTVKEDIETIKEDVSDLQETSNRIETLAKSEIKYVDALSDRVLKLEKSKA